MGRIIGKLKDRAALKEPILTNVGKKAVESVLMLKGSPETMKLSEWETWCS